MKKILASIVVMLSLTTHATQTIEVITDRSDFHLKKIAQNFENATGIKVNLTFVNKGIIERAKTGYFDMMISKDSSEVIASKDFKLLKSVPENVFSVVPQGFKDKNDKQWILMSYRIRAFHVSKDTKDVPLTYEDLAKPQYKGRICIRPLTDNYNLEMFGTMLYDMGEEKFKKWFVDFKTNLARNPIGNDRAQVEGIYNKICDIAIANTYYRGIMSDDENQKKWVDSTIMYIPNQGNNSTGAIALYAAVGALTNNNAVENFMIYLVGDDIQKELSAKNYEYPINLKNTSEDSKKYGVEQGLDYKNIKIHVDIQNDLFELRRKAYLIVKSVK